MSEKNEKCIFAAEEDCPLESLGISCDACMENDLGKVIRLAIEDYTGLGDNFTEIFKMFDHLMQNKEKTVELNLPVEKIQMIARVVSALFSDSEQKDPEKIVYKRLIFLFFRFLIEDFESSEYSDSDLLH